MPSGAKEAPWRFQRPSTPGARRASRLEKQFRSWKEIGKPPYDKRSVDAYTRTRVILMNGIEIEAWNYGHQFHRTTGNQEIRALLAQTRRVEQQQQTTVNWLNPADQTVLETTIGYEQVAIDMTAYLARNEPDLYVREAFNFGLLEDFDHLYRYSELIDYLEGTDPNSIVQGKTEIIPGRPTEDHHNNPEVRLLRHYEKNRALPLSKLHVWTLLSGEQQTYTTTRTRGRSTRTRWRAGCTPRSARSRRSTSPSTGRSSTRPRRPSSGRSSTS